MNKDTVYYAFAVIIRSLLKHNRVSKEDLKRDFSELVDRIYDAFI